MIIVVPLNVTFNGDNIYLRLEARLGEFHCVVNIKREAV